MVVNRIMILTQIIKWKLTLVNTSPLRIGDDANQFVIDQFGNPFIPGTTLAGAFRSFAQTFCSDNEMKMLFGDESTHQRDAQLIISDGKSTQNHEIETRTGIRIDGKTKTIADNALFSRNLVATGAKFNMQITLKTTEEKMKRYVDIINKILQAIQSGIITLGSYKSIGAGKLSIASCESVHFDCTNESDLYAYVNESKPYKQVVISDSLLMKDIIEIQISGRTASPILVGGVYPNDSNKPDETFMTTHYGEPLIPASSIKGVLRHRVNRIANILEIIEKEKYITYLFGSDESSSDKERGYLQFEDIVLENKSETVSYRIGINPFTGGTRTGALLSEETVEGTFSTTIYLLQKNEYTNVALALLLFALRDLALQQVTIGSGSAIGRGLLHIETLNMKTSEKEVLWDFTQKQTVDKQAWLLELQKALETVRG